MSKIIYRSLMVCRYRSIEKLWNKRLFFTSIVFIIFIYLAAENILQFSAETQVKVTPWIFPFLSSDWICQMIISGYFLWIISVLCEVKESDIFVRARAGEYAWRIGTCLSVLMCAFLYTLFVIVISSALLFPRMEFSMEWGKVWNTLAKTNASSVYNIQIIVSPIIIRAYKPFEALIRAGLLQFLCLTWLAVLMYFLNDLTRKALGVFVSLAFILLDVMLANTLSERLYIYSPITMAQLGNYSLATARYGISFIHSLRFFIIGIFLFSGLIIIQGNSKWRAHIGKYN